MLRFDIGSPPGRKQDRGPGALPLGLSFALHGAALTWLVLFQEVTPPEPYAVIAVELVRDADLMGMPGRDSAEQSRSSQVMQEGSAQITENAVDPPERVSEVGPQDDKADPFDAQSASNNPPVERAEEPTRVSARAPMPENTSPTYDIGPLTPSDLSPSAENSSAPEKPIGSPPPAPRRKPLHLKPSSDRNLAENGFQAPLAEMKEPPPRPIDEKSAQEVAQPDTGRTSALMQQMARLNVRKDDAIAGLPARARSNGHFGNLGDSLGTLPQYSGGGLSNVAPRYPYLARRRGQEGRVVLRVQVTADGEAAAVQLRQSSGYRLLDKAAVEAVKTWRFVPARRGGLAVAGSVEVPVSFKLRD